MEKQEATRARQTGEVCHVVRARMSEPGSVRILGFCVLAVVDQHVGSGGDLESRDPFRLDRREIDGQGRFVIGEVREAATRVLDPVTDGAEPSIHGSCGASCSCRRAGTSANRTGNSGGERYCEIRSDNERVGDAGPQMWSSVPASQRGAKNPRPSR
jgi:hypothetical protein